MRQTGWPDTPGRLRAKQVFSLSLSLSLSLSFPVNFPFEDASLSLSLSLSLSSFLSSSLLSLSLSLSLSFPVNFLFDALYLSNVHFECVVFAVPLVPPVERARERDRERQRENVYVCVCVCVCVCIIGTASPTGRFSYTCTSLKACRFSSLLAAAVAVATSDRPPDPAARNCCLPLSGRRSLLDTPHSPRDHPSAPAVQPPPSLPPSLPKENDTADM